MANNASWLKIFNDYGILNHDFESGPYTLTATQIKKACQNFKNTSEKEVRLLCKQDSREDRPTIFTENELFLLPKKNGEYYIVKGEGYVDIPEINTPVSDYHKKLSFELETSTVGDSEMQFVDYAYANSLIRTFMGDDSLVLTIRGRKYTPHFEFRVGRQILHTNSVQTEVDAGYEGASTVVLVEAKNSHTRNTIIRQLYYPYRQWSACTNKPVKTLFFEKRVVNGENIFYLWLYEFTDPEDYNSIQLVRSARYRII